MKKHKKVIYRIILVILLITFCMIAFSQKIVVRKYVITTDKVSSDIDLLFISDLHSSIYGVKQKELIRQINACRPDIILLGGDIADDIVDHEGTRLLLEEIYGKYTSYYVTGNHEFWAKDRINIENMLIKYGVTILRGDTDFVTVNHNTISISGIDDPSSFHDLNPETEPIPTGWKNQYKQVNDTINQNYFNILLSHRPELVQIYQNSNFDLVLSGHAHGGQIRIPGILNGLYAPNQGMFPKYAGGRYELGDVTMIVSRGLCKNSLPRVFNRPELVLIQLKSF